MARRQTWQARRFEIFESARHFRIESNLDVRFEFESNLEASHVPTVKFQLRRSINVPLTESSTYNTFCIERSPKMGISGQYWGQRKIFGGNVLEMQRLPSYAFTDIFSPDLTRRVVAFCMGIAICHRRKFGQVQGSTAPLPEVVGKLRLVPGLRCRKAPWHPLGPSTTTRKNRNYSAM